LLPLSVRKISHLLQFFFRLTIMIKTLLTAFAVFGMFGFTAQAQTTPTGSATMGSRPAGTATKSATSTSKTMQSNSGNMAPNRSSTAGHPAATSNNPVDATGKPVGTTQSATMGTSTSQKPKK
jgi:hypothetical protein